MSVKVREKIKGSGDWWIFIDHSGRRKAKKVGRNKKLALDMAKKIEAKILLKDTGLLDTPERPRLFGEYALTWIETIVPSTCKESSQKDYKIVLNNHILPEFDKTPIETINRLDIKKYLMDKLNKGLSDSRVKHIKVAMSRVFNLALDDGVIQVNPARNLGKLIGKKKPKTVKDIDPLTREELSLLLSTIQDKFPEYYPLTLVLSRTGMRIGEAIALKWDDIDFNGRFINVQRSYSSGMFLSSPKNGKSRRVDMSMQLTEILWKLKHERENGAQDGAHMSSWVFPGKTPIGVKDQSHYRKRVFYKALDIAGIRKIRIHDIRHTVASLLLNAGESLKYVKDQLGHSSIKVTVDVYGHLAPEGNKEAVDKLDDIPNSIIRNLSATIPADTIKKDSRNSRKSLINNMVEGGGFEPPKA